MPKFSFDPPLAGGFALTASRYPSASLLAPI